MLDLRCRLLTARRTPKRVAFRSPFFGGTEIRFLTLGIRGRVFAGYIFVMAVVQMSLAAVQVVDSILLYVQVLPCCQLFDAFTDIFEATSRFLEKIVDPFTDPIRLTLCAEKIDLLTKAGNVRRETEKL